MTVALLWARAEWRQRWVSLVLLTLAFAIATGVVFAAGAGARRTATAYTRLTVDTLRYDVSVEDDRGDDGVLDDIASLSMVKATDRLGLFFLASREPELEVLLAAPRDGVALRELERPVVVEGRMHAFDDPREVMANQAFVDATGLGVGDHIEFASFAPEQLEQLFAIGDPGGPPRGPAIDVEIVGIAKLPVYIDRPDPQLIGTPAFFGRYNTTAGNIDTIQRVLLHGGERSIDEFMAALEELPRYAPENVFVEFGRDDDARVEDGTRLQALGLWIFAAAAAAATLIASAQAFARQLQLTQAAHNTLAAMGMPASARALAVGTALAPVVVVGTVGGVTIAALASGLFPTGLAELAEPSPGVRVDGLFLAAAGIATTVVGLAVIAAQSRRTVVGRVGASRPSPVVAALGRAGLGPVAIAGAQLALEPGHGPRRLPVRSTLAATAATIAALAAALTFAQSLSHMTDTPRLWGWSWDATVTVGSERDAARDSAALMAEDDGVRAVAIAEHADVEIGGADIETQALTQIKGTIAPVLLDGAAPQGLDEIALGPAVLDRLGIDVGDTIRINDAQSEGVEVRVSGNVLFPAGEDEQGAAAWATPELLALLSLESSGAYDLHLDVADGTDIEELIDPIDGTGDVFIAEPPTTVKNIELTRSAPTQIAAFVAVLGLAAVAHALMTAARRRRHDLAVLRALGLLRGDVARVVGWHALVLALVASIVGVPAGIIAGRALWTTFARDAYLVPRPTVTAVTVGLLVVGPVLATLAVAAVPAFAARRSAIAETLRAE